MRARLTVEAGHAVPLVCELGLHQVVKLGRNKKNTIVLHDQHASRWHAEVVPESERWMLRDCDTTNGTRLNGVRLDGSAVLESGDEVRIGDTCLRFDLVEEGSRDTREDEGADDDFVAPPPVTATVSDSSHPTLLADELNVLVGFMSHSLRDASPQELVRRTLTTLHQQTGATLTGFLALDEDDQLPRVVVPEKASVDAHLSRQLTARMQREGRTVWLGGRQERALDSDSLVAFRDAFCVPVTVEGAALGAVHVYRSGRHFAEREVRFGEALVGYLARSLDLLRAQRALAADNSRLREHAAGPDDDMIGSSPPMRQLRQLTLRFADRPSTILIHGESGSGKELVALSLHRKSLRAEGPLVTVNCAAIAASMPEAELFGHVAGSFTGATSDRDGLFAQADMGTLFLDEIGELSEECQAKLLRVLETRTFRPVGAKADVKTDVRILAATNRDLERECREGRFRRDLFYRLGVSIRVPPLRERAADVPALTEHFLRKLALEYRRSVTLTPTALARLQEYNWPGNVRQLRSVLEHAVAMSEGPLIDVDELHLSSDGGPPTLNEGLPLNLEALEKWAICQALQQTRGNNTQAAQLLGIHRDTLLTKIRKYDIDREREAGKR